MKNLNRKHFRFWKVSTNRDRVIDINFSKLDIDIYLSKQKFWWKRYIEENKVRTIKDKQEDQIYENSA